MLFVRASCFCRPFTDRAAWDIVQAFQNAVHASHSDINTGEQCTIVVDLWFPLRLHMPRSNTFRAIPNPVLELFLLTYVIYMEQNLL